MVDIQSQFEEAFHKLLPPEGENLSEHPPSAVLPRKIESRVQTALTLFSQGYYPRCQEALQGLEALESSEPRIAALLAACRSFQTGRLYPGIEACLHRMEGRAHLPDLYIVLGVLLAGSNQRAQAYAAFRQGLRLAPDHRALRAHLERMGVRRPPVLPFLPRSHFPNRWLGRLRAWLLERLSAGSAD